MNRHRKTRFLGYWVYYTKMFQLSNATWQTFVFVTDDAGRQEWR